MKQKIIIAVLFILTCNYACSQKENLLTADEFEKRLAATPEAQLIDVRTPEEFSEGHLKNALSMNVNSNDLKERSQYLDKTKPVFVYCYMGPRSAKACEYLRTQGFTNVYDLKGGYSNWTDLNKPVEDITPNAPGISGLDFQKQVATGKTLVDFNAPWCAPCIKMKPILDEIEKELAGKIKVLRFDKDKNRELANSFNITELPVILVFENGKLIKQTSGFKNKEQLLELLK